jgi:acyl carrier protein
MSPMDTLIPVKKILRDTLNLGARADRLTADSELLGSLPEFDSMAVVSVVASLENEFGISVGDDELSAEVFATVGSLAQFVSGKLAE